MNSQVGRQVLVGHYNNYNAATAQLDDKQRTIIMQWFMYGAGLAGVVRLLGLLLPHIISRRKKNNRWMN